MLAEFLNWCCSPIVLLLLTAHASDHASAAGYVSAAEHATALVSATAAAEVPLQLLLFPEGELLLVLGLQLLWLEVLILLD